MSHVGGRIGRRSLLTVAVVAVVVFGLTAGGGFATVGLFSDSGTVHGEFTTVEEFTVAGGPSPASTDGSTAAPPVEDSSTTFGSDPPSNGTQPANDTQDTSFDGNGTTVTDGESDEPSESGNGTDEPENGTDDSGNGTAGPGSDWSDSDTESSDTDSDDDTSENDGGNSENNGGNSDSDVGDFGNDEGGADSGGDVDETDDDLR